MIGHGCDLDDFDGSLLSNCIAKFGIQWVRVSPSFHDKFGLDAVKRETYHDIRSS